MVQLTSDKLGTPDHGSAPETRSARASAGTGGGGGLLLPGLLDERLQLLLLHQRLEEVEQERDVVVLPPNILHLPVPKLLHHDLLADGLDRRRHRR